MSTEGLAKLALVVFRRFTWRTLVIFLTLFYAPLAAYEPASATSKARMQLEIDLLKNILEVRYAPRVWKESRYGWNIDSAAEEAKKRIALHPNEQIPLKDFQRIVNDFFLTFKDYHTRVFFYSTEEASLPLHVKGVNGRYFIAYLDRQKLVSDCPIQIGDELLFFNGRSTHLCVEELRRKEQGFTHETTDRALSEILLTNRSGMYGHHVPSGPVKLTLRAAATQELYTYQIHWNYKPERLKHSCHCAWEEPTSPTFEEAFKIIFAHEMNFPLWDAESLQMGGSKKNGHKLGHRYSYTPLLGTLLWESPDTLFFHAYLFENEEHRNIGYVRIPHYQGRVKDAQNFGILIDFFQENADALIIDQLNNPGGSVFFLYALASMLTEKPLDIPMHRMAITHHEAAMAATMIPVLEAVNNENEAHGVLGQLESFLQGQPVSLHLVHCFLSHLRFILDQWQSGRTLTDLSPLCGIKKIAPNPQHCFKKPILLLTNCLNFSGGDFFAAIMQDNKCAKILGERTAGAGGTFIRSTHLNPFGIRTYGLTTSIAERPNGQTLENLGVTPDIPYSLTERDLQHQYIDYKDKILTTIKSLLDK